MSVAVDVLPTAGRGSGDLDWLVQRLVEEVPGVAHVVLVSADGMLMARSRAIPQERANQLAAVTSGLTALAGAAASLDARGRVLRSTVVLAGGRILLSEVGDGSHLALTASADSDLGVVGYEMTLLAERVGERVRALAREGAQG